MGTPSKSQCGDTEESMKRWLRVPAMMGTDTEGSPRQLTEPAEGRPGRQPLLKDGLDFASKRRVEGGWAFQVDGPGCGEGRVTEGRTIQGQRGGPVGIMKRTAMSRRSSSSPEVSGLQR